jgi:hypothetical protein
MGQHLWAECVYESWDVLRILRRPTNPQTFCESWDVLRILRRFAILRCFANPQIPGMFYESSDVLRFLGCSTNPQTFCDSSDVLRFFRCFANPGMSCDSGDVLRILRRLAILYPRTVLRNQNLRPRSLILYQGIRF